MNKYDSLDKETAVTSMPDIEHFKKEKLTEVQFQKKINSFLIASNSLKESKNYLIIKRFIDFVGAGLGLIFLVPLFSILAIVIKLEDKKASIFFTQYRIGLNGKPFKMYKFRSMVSDAEEKLEFLRHQNEVTGAMFKIENDPRVTKVGRFIRKTSLDELPQLWNVLKGDMSLVGPRPPLPKEVANYTSYDLQRLLVLPGCTGLWQVSGRSSLSFDEMIKLDIIYINNRSVKFDLKIILKTFKEIYSSKNAY